MDFNTVVNTLIASSILALLTLVYKRIAKFMKSRRNVKEWQQSVIENILIPHLDSYSDSEILSLITSNNYIPTMGQYEGPHIADEIHIAKDRFLLVDKLLSDFFSKGKKLGKKRYAILGGSGMGKSTFSASLLYRYIYSFKVNIPKVSFYVLYLGSENILEEIRELNSRAQNNSIVLLDALDENAEAVKNCQEFLRRIELETKNFKYVIITSRTQLFPKEMDEPIDIGVKHPNPGKKRLKYEKIYISPFSSEEIEKYITNKYDGDAEKKERATKLINNSADLMCRPMILSFIDDLLYLDDFENLTNAKLYLSIIDSWLSRECTMQETINTSFLKEEDLFLFSKKLAFCIYKKWLNNSNNQQFKQTDRKSTLSLTSDEYDDFIISNGYKDINYPFEGRSLINRTTDGSYKFAHKSFWEFFLAVISIEEPWVAIRPDGLDTAINFAKELHATYLNGKASDYKYISFYNPKFFIAGNFSNNFSVYPADFRETIEEKKSVKSYIQKIENLLGEKELVSETEKQRLDRLLSYLWEALLRRLPGQFQLISDIEENLCKLHKEALSRGNEAAGVDIIIKAGMRGADEVSQNVQSIITLFQQFFSGKENVIKVAEKILSKMKSINIWIDTYVDTFGYERKSFKNNDIVVFPFLFDLSEYIIHKTLLNEYLFVGNGFGNDESLFMLINNMVERRNRIKTICILRDKATIEQHVHFIDNLYNRVKNKPLCMIVKIPIKDKYIYYTINRQSIENKSSINAFFNKMVLLSN